jgi:HAD superfamily hydrolase (TIGR01484 family)
MTKLFVLDLDGCVTHPFITPDWESITRIRELNILSRSDKSIPSLSICTGRPYAYAEAIAQWLDIQNPIVFESGGGVYFPNEQRLEFAAPFFEHFDKVQEMKQWIEHLVETKFPDVLIEFTKKTDAGLVHSDEAKIVEMFELATDYVYKNYIDFEVHRTAASVNIILKDCSKGSGIKWLSKLLGITLDEIAYVGDSSGDISALKIVGTPYTPANGAPELDVFAKRLRGETSIGVLEAYEELISFNRREMSLVD